MRRTAPRPMADALGALTARLAPASTLAAVQQLWPQAVGAAIAAAAQPTAEAGGVLTVQCESSVWAQELELMSDELIARLNSGLADSEIQSLRCRAR
ncbi:MAG TPA: DciA family protein [Solirubrobacteraceae bacterium]|nr:DciA family protein [Solirubrobacteraceae bacterium]